MDFKALVEAAPFHPDVRAYAAHRRTAVWYGPKKGLHADAAHHVGLALKASKKARGTSAQYRRTQWSREDPQKEQHKRDLERQAADHHNEAAVAAAAAHKLVAKHHNPHHPMARAMAKLERYHRRQHLAHGGIDVGEHPQLHTMGSVEHQAMNIDLLLAEGYSILAEAEGELERLDETELAERSLRKELKLARKLSKAAPTGGMAKRLHQTAISASKHARNTHAKQGAEHKDSRTAHYAAYKHAATAHKFFKDRGAKKLQKSMHHLKRYHLGFIAKKSLKKY